jgi:hypothetical protein
MRIYRPLPHGHPAIGEPCYYCGDALRAGDRTVLVPVAPAGAEAAVRAEQGRPFNAKAEVAHARCAD